MFKSMCLILYIEYLGNELGNRRSKFRGGHSGGWLAGLDVTVSYTSHLRKRKCHGIKFFVFFSIPVLILTQTAEIWNMLRLCVISNGRQLQSDLSHFLLFSDAFVGGVIGLLFAYICYRQHYPPFLHTDCHLPYASLALCTTRHAPVSQEVPQATDNATSLPLEGITEGPVWLMEPSSFTARLVWPTQTGWLLYIPVGRPVPVHFILHWSSSLFPSLCLVLIYQPHLGYIYTH